MAGSGQAGASSAAPSPEAGGATSRGAAALRAVATYYCCATESRYDDHSCDLNIENTKLCCLVTLARVSKSLRLEVQRLTYLLIGLEETQTTYWVGHRKYACTDCRRGQRTFLDVFDPNTTRLDFRPFPNIRELEVDGLFSEQGVDCVLRAASCLPKLEQLHLSFAFAPKEQTMVNFVQQLVGISGESLLPSHNEVPVSEENKRLLRPIAEEAFDAAKKRLRPLMLRFARGCKIEGFGGGRSIFSPTLKSISFRQSEDLDLVGCYLAKLDSTIQDNSFGFHEDNNFVSRVLQQNLPPTATLWFVLSEPYHTDPLTIDEILSLLPAVDLESAIEAPDSSYDGVATFLQFMMASNIGIEMDERTDEGYRARLLFELVEAGASTAALRRAPCEDGHYEECMQLVAQAAEALGCEAPTPSK